MAEPKVLISELITDPAPDLANIYLPSTRAGSTRKVTGTQMGNLFKASIVSAMLATTGISGTLAVDTSGVNIVRSAIHYAHLSNYGAKEDGSDSAAALAVALDSGKPVMIDGHYTINSQVIYEGSATIVGNGRKFSSLTWPNDAASVGIKISVENEGDYIGVDNVGFYTEGTSGTALELDYSGQVATGGGNNVFQIESRGHVKGCTISGTTKLTTYFNKGIRVVQGLNVLTEDNYCIGGPSATSPSAAAGIEYVATDLHMVSAKIWKNQCLYFQNGCSLMDVEGAWIEGNDFQACALPLKINNTLEVKNQIRVVNNHFGGHAGCIWVHGVQFLMLVASEIYLSDSTTDYRTHVYLEDVTGGKIEANTIRTAGNDANTYPTLGFELVHTVGSPIGNLFHINIDNNQFFDVKDGLKHDPTNSTACRMGEGNMYYGMTGTAQLMNGNTQAYHRAVIGDGTLALPSGGGSTLTIEKRGGAPLALNRLSSDGAILTFHRDYGAAVASISLTTSLVTYNTTSDRRLKSNIRDLEGSGAFIDALQPRRFEMGGVEMAGFIADEFQNVSPISVTGEPGAVDEDGSPIYQGMQASTPEVMAHVIAELQSLRRQISHRNKQTFELLLACYRSGQVSEAQWQQHLDEDSDFRSWLDDRERGGIS